MDDEDWLKAAMIDDSAVAELLLQLHQSTPPSKPDATPPLPLEWTVRQRRSRPVTVHVKKQAPRASPTTPLSWSGATSVSGGGGASGAALDGGSEESSRPPPNKTSDTTRSKVIGANETSTTKRPRKKKTLPELKEEETLLLKERRLLKRELSSLRLNLEKERVKNEELKRMKLELLPGPANETTETEALLANSKACSDPSWIITTACDPPTSCPMVTGNDALLQVSQASNRSQMRKEVEHLEAKFVLPDLNLPLDEDCTPEIPCGVS